MDIHFTYGDRTFDAASLPAATVSAMFGRGITHYLGSEAASKVNGKIRAKIAEERKCKASDVTAKDVAAFREANPDETDEMLEQVRNEFSEAMSAGTVGHATRTIGANALEREMFRIAASRVKSLLASKGISFPKAVEGGDEPTVSIGGEEYTLADLAGRAIEKDREAIREAAEAVLAERKAKAAAKAAAKASGPVESVEDLGL